MKSKILAFAFKAYIAYSIIAANESNLFDEVMVSTDSLEIKNIAEQHGASVPFFRSEKNSDDYAPVIDVLIEVVNSYLDEGKKFDNLCCIFPCAPFVTADKLIYAFEQLIKKKFASVFPVVNYSHPIQRALTLKGEKVNMVDEKYLTKMTQEFETFYHDTGQFYFCNIKKVFSKKQILTPNSKGIVVSEIEIQDIDSEIDWKLAELKYKLINNKPQY